MRTTVNIDEHVLASMKQIAARSHRPLGDVITDALRAYLARSPGTDGSAVVELPASGGSGFMPGVDLEDKDALAALLDEDDDARAAR